MALSTSAALGSRSRRISCPFTTQLVFRAQKEQGAGFVGGAREIFSAIRQMPATMKQLAPVQMLTWLGLFCMWLYFPVAVARNVFGAPDANSPLYQEGVEWAGVCFGAYSAVCFAFMTASFDHF